MSSRNTSVSRECDPIWVRWSQEVSWEVPNCLSQQGKACVFSSERPKLSVKQRKELQLYNRKYGGRVVACCPNLSFYLILCLSDVTLAPHCGRVLLWLCWEPGERGVTVGCPHHRRRSVASNSTLQRGCWLPILPWETVCTAVKMQLSTSCPWLRTGEVDEYRVSSSW